MPARLELVRRGSARVVSGPTPPPAPPSAQAVEARQLIDGWLKTSFIAKGDAVDDLVERIAAVLAERDARPDALAPADGRPFCSGG
jgi:hypothetical protein